MVHISRITQSQQWWGGGWYEKKKLLRRKINEWWEEIKIYGEIETAAKTFIVLNIDNDTKS